MRQLIYVTILSLAPTASADVQEYTNKSAWTAAAGSHATIDFVGFPDFTWITDQYADVGVMFTDGFDLVGPDKRIFPNDGFGLYGAIDSITVEFSQPITSIAVDFPGSVSFDLYHNGKLQYVSAAFGPSGVGHFAGLVSDEPFDKAVIYDVEGAVYIDDLFFGPPIPAPGVLVTLGMFALIAKRRRRV